MRTRVKCVNCGIIWDIVENTSASTEFTKDLQNVCPGCNSNAYEILEKRQGEEFYSPNKPSQ